MKSVMKPGCALFLFLACASALAQQAAGEPAATATSASPETKEDIGDIHPASGEAALPRFRATAQATGQFTSNAKLQGNHSSGDVLWIPALETGYNVPIGKHYSLDLMVRSESVLYSDYTENGSFGFSSAATFDYHYKQEWPRFYVDVEPYWYQSLDTGDKLASALGFAGGLDQGIPFNRGLTLFFWSAKFTNFQASPSTDDRYQYRLMLGLTHQIRPSLYGQIYYSYQYSDYHNFSRQDSRNVVGASISQQINNNLFLSLTTSFVDNDSDNAQASYQSVNAGLSLTWQF